MTGYELSPVCQALVEKAETLINPEKPIFTAERYLVAVIDAVAASDACLSGAEWDAVVAWHNKGIANPVAAREKLMAYITAPNAMAFLSDVYAKKRLKAAADMARGVVASINLCLAIALEPSETIRSLLTSDASSAEWRMETVSVSDMVRGGNLGALFAGGLGGKPMGDASASAASAAPAQEQPAVEEAPVTVEGNKAQVVSLIEDIKRIRNNLKDKIFGQDNAINMFVTGYYQARIRSMTDKKHSRVLASFVFAGPPGVGKTYLAEQAAAELKLPFMRLDMSEYSGSEGVVEFCGLDKGYKDSHPGHVTMFVKKNPRCVLLFDEVEKAHIDVIHLFLQMLDAGQVRDRHENAEISFREVICIFTSNAGRPLYQDTDMQDFSALSQKVVMKALRQDVNPHTMAPYFPAALCSRFASGNVVMFNHIQAHHLRDIAQKEISRLAENLETGAGIHFDIDESVYTALLLSEGAAADARTIRGRAETFFNNETYELFRLVETKRQAGSLANIRTVKMMVDLEYANPEVSSLFASGAQIKILALTSADRVAALQEQLPEYQVLGAQSSQQAVEVLKNHHVDFVLLDFNYEADENARQNLNIEDVVSPARSFFHFVREHKQGLPVYILEEKASAMSDEERISFMSQGCRGMVNIDDAVAFVEQCRFIASSLCQQESMIRLAKENKVVAFETAQTVSEDGTEAVISLFDMSLEVALDAEDSKNVLSSVSTPNVRFEDVIGAEDAKAELQYFVEYLRNPKQYLGTGVKTPRGVLLYGPPGTGKTMLAKAMACESGCTFIAAEGNTFLKKYVGEGPEKVHELFATARKYAPAILFIDEIDAIAKERTGGDNSHHEAQLTAFLAEMDGFTTDPTKPVFVLAATNYDVKPGSPKSLDSALMRRFDNRIYVDLPNKEERIRFMKKKIAAGKAFSISDEQVESLASRGVGMSLAELDSVMELALRSAIRQRSTVVNDAVLEEAFENFNSGEQKRWDPSQLERVARHEAGHALLCWLGGEKPSYLTVVARGNHGGYMQRAEQEGKAIYTRDELLARIRTSLGGRAAEIVYYGDKDGISTGASGDLQSATAVAQQIVCTYGMDEEFGLAVVSGAVANGEMSAEVRTVVNRILKEQMDEAVRLVRENKDAIDALVMELMYKNHLNEQEIARILSTNKTADFKE